VTIPVFFEGLENLLNEIEQNASGFYEIVQINTVSSVFVVTVRLFVSDEPTFDEEEIKRKLGFI